MKKYRKIVRRRLEAALRLDIRKTSPWPKMDEPGAPVPVEVIDLATGPFEDRFPDLAAKYEKRKRR